MLGFAALYQRASLAGQLGHASETQDPSSLYYAFGQFLYHVSGAFTRFSVHHSVRHLYYCNGPYYWNLRRASLVINIVFPLVTYIFIPFLESPVCANCSRMQFHITLPHEFQQTIMIVPLGLDITTWLLPLFPLLFDSSQQRKKTAAMVLVWCAAGVLKCVVSVGRIILMFMIWRSTEVHQYMIAIMVVTQ